LSSFADNPFQKPGTPCADLYDFSTLPCKTARPLTGSPSPAG